MPRLNSITSKLSFPHPVRANPLQHLDPGLALSKGATPGTTHLLTWIFECVTSSQHLHSCSFAGLSCRKQAARLSSAWTFRKHCSTLPRRNTGSRREMKMGVSQGLPMNRLFYSLIKAEQTSEWERLPRGPN